MANPPSPTNAMHCRPGWAKLRGDRVRQPGRHGGEVSRQVELPVPADVEVASRPGGDRPGVRREDGVVRGVTVDDAHQILRLDRVPIGVLQRRHLVAPVRHRCLGGPEERSVRLPREQRDQRAQRPRRVADQGDVGGDPVADGGRVDVDLHDLDGSWFRQVLGVREVGADHEQRVGRLHGLFGGLGAQQPDAAGGERVVVGHAALAGERLDDRAAEQLGDLEHLGPGA